MVNGSFRMTIPSSTATATFTKTINSALAGPTSLMRLKNTTKAIAVVTTPSANAPIQDSVLALGISAGRFIHAGTT